MRGKPKFLNTKQDYMNCMALDDNIMSKSEKIQMFEDLLADKEDWIYQGLVEKGKGKEDDTHKVVESPAFEEGEEPTYAQYVFTKNPGARIFLLGFTVEEVEGILAKLRA